MLFSKIENSVGGSLEKLKTASFDKVDKWRWHFTTVFVLRGDVRLLTLPSVCCCLLWSFCLFVISYYTGLALCIESLPRIAVCRSSETKKREGEKKGAHRLLSGCVTVFCAVRRERCSVQARKESIEGGGGGDCCSSVVVAVCFGGNFNNHPSWFALRAMLRVSTHSII
jgi:hypothetical protein